ncbi:MAG: NAD(P)/FAD-dependent oxidoreductase [Solirubrobacteraceae bacterium]|nr:NAD(P)/FAD-dependent oxidoreductase [Solirubrobacteraceae bacterium]
MPHEHLDVLIVGAGLSGIGAARHLQRRHPARRFALLEARDALGGTWDLFRYPGVRSDSDMHTLGYGFRPWREARAIADGPSILRYLQDTAREYGIDRHIRTGHRVVGAAWSTAEARWTVEVERTDTGEALTLTCDFLLGCTGYYRYDEGYTPELPGRERFGGTIVHPQHWPEDLDHAGRRVVIIGSGATAVTLVPALAADAAHVTMLQRSPTYVASLPGVDPFAERARRLLPDAVAFPLVRWKNVLQQIGVYQLSQRRPETVKRFLRRILERQLPDGYDIDRHFTPRYDPWDQRLCLAPDGDLFRAIRHGDASVVTDRIETLTETGIRLESGEELDADLIVTATGLNLLLLGGIDLTVDGRVVHLPDVMTYKGMMLEGVPNLAFALGYTNASWTLKADLTGEVVGRLLQHMDRHGHRICVPRNDDPRVVPTPLLDFDAGYVRRALAELPKSGSRAPWRLRMNYALDVVALRHGKVDDGVMRFSGAGRSATPDEAPVVA